MPSKFDAPVQERDVESYHQEALAMIAKWGSYWMIYDQDVIANVANAIARAEFDFDPDRGCKRVTLRCTYGRRAIWNEVRKRQRMAKRPSHFSLSRPVSEDDERTRLDIEDKKANHEQDLFDSEEKKIKLKKLRSIMDKRRTTCLTETQKECLKMRYFEHMSVVEIAELRKTSKQAVSEIINNGIKRIKNEGNI
tara:strand:- start:5171 stop:5752 length:582 start_codon:yes stop_codon:yes gene_type:complete